jgi:hypothetical protein
MLIYEKRLLKITIPQTKVTQLPIMYLAVVDAGFLKTKVYVVFKEKNICIQGMRISTS